MMNVRISKLIKETEDVETLEQLAVFLRDKKNVKISERTLYNWQDGNGFQSAKLDEIAKKLGYDNPLELIEVVA